MSSSEPTFLLSNHNSFPQTLNNRTTGKATTMFDLNSDFVIMNNSDDASYTSSTMSDEASWLSESDHEDDGLEDDMDISKADALPLQTSRGLKMSPSRSTVSLGAYFSNLKTHQHHSFRLPPSAQAMGFGRTASVANFVKPPPLKAIQKTSAQAAISPNDVKPGDHLCKLLETKLDRVPYDSLGDYFLKTTPEHVAAWDGDLLRAIRNHDLAAIKKMHHEGKPLQACNQFGESILHVCVRRGTPAILAYLLQHGKVSPRVRCDYGRTPLHDALWTFSSDDRSLHMMAILLKQCPEMLLVTDKRGFTPLDYVPRDRWADCCKFLDKCMPLLVKLKNNGRN